MMFTAMGVNIEPLANIPQQPMKVIMKTAGILRKSCVSTAADREVMNIAKISTNCRRTVKAAPQKRSWAIMGIINISKNV
jgi:hypothetical protein